MEATSQREPRSDSSGKKKRASGGGRGTPSIVKDLNLAGGEKKTRLKDFYGQFSTSSNFERNLIFVYYLQHELEVKGISIDHVFTCYRDVQVKAPEALQQSLLDTAHHRGWLDTSSAKDIKMTVCKKGVGSLFLMPSEKKMEYATFLIVSPAASATLKKEPPPSVIGIPKQVCGPISNPSPSPTLLPRFTIDA